jgi:hypothetical protein
MEAIKQCKIHVNLADNNTTHEKFNGLNPNKRGRIQDSDLEKLKKASIT